MVLAGLLATATHANNIQVTSPTLVGTSTANATTQVVFNISWANSWRTSSAPNNRDAAWVFVKYRDANTGEWQHAQLGSDAQHSAPSGSSIATGLLTPGTAYNATTNWGVGAFIYRATNGVGTFAANGVRLRWNYGQNGITYTDIAEVKVFAVEMVLVPQGSFSVGGGGGTFTEIYHFKNGTTNNPFPISSESAINMANVNGSLWASQNVWIETATLPAAFPKGFAGFYMMKYEITQQQYVDFLNTLTRTQQNTRTGTNLAVGVTSVTNRYVISISSTVQSRNGIRCNGSIDANNPITFYCDLDGNGTGGNASDGSGVACNYLRWADVAAYLDWSGLRPMTELEYEKACRGPLTPVANGYAWGSATGITGVTNITNSGGMNELSNTAGANAVYGAILEDPNNVNVRGPMRVGVFATGTTTRAQSGAGYYGSMELSGNVWERTVTVGNAQGRAYTGISGNGTLDANGNANAASWPGVGAEGAGLRGGGWKSISVSLGISDRNNAGYAYPLREDACGGRGCRSVP